MQQGSRWSARLLLMSSAAYASHMPLGDDKGSRISNPDPVRFPRGLAPSQPAGAHSSDGADRPTVRRPDRGPGHDHDSESECASFVDGDLMLNGTAQAAFGWPDETCTTALPQFLSEAQQHDASETLATLCDRHAQNEVATILLSSYDLYWSAPEGTLRDVCQKTCCEIESSSQGDESDPDESSEEFCSSDYPCPSGFYCNFDYSTSGFCERCGDEDQWINNRCQNRGLPYGGVADCAMRCQLAPVPGANASYTSITVHNVYELHQAVDAQNTLRVPTVLVNEIVLAASGSPYLLHKTLELSTAITIRAEEHEHVVLEARNSSSVRPFRVMLVYGVARIHLIRLTIRSGREEFGAGLFVLGAPKLILDACDVTNNVAIGGQWGGGWGAKGGGMLITGQAHVVLRDSSLSSNVVAPGGYGPGIYMSGGRLEAINSRLFFNPDRGGLYVADGTALLSNKTLLHGPPAFGWRVLCEGSFPVLFPDLEPTYCSFRSADLGWPNLIAAGGELYYLLPAFPGHWLPSETCSVYRQSCDPFNPKYEECLAAFETCALTPDPSFEQPATEPCMPRTFMQHCDWFAEPNLLGKMMYNLPQAQAKYEDFPYACEVREE